VFAKEAEALTLRGRAPQWFGLGVKMPFRSKPEVVDAYDLAKSFADDFSKRPVNRSPPFMRLHRDRLRQAAIRGRTHVTGLRVVVSFVR
jgi:hypothetical protein